MTEGQTDEENPTDTVRVKFTIQNHQKQKLDRLAQDFHSGNCSGLIRQAIELYDWLLGDGNLNILKEIHVTVSGLDERVAKLEDDVATLVDHRSPSPTGTDTPAVAGRDRSLSDREAADQSAMRQSEVTDSDEMQVADEIREIIERSDDDVVLLTDILEQSRFPKTTAMAAIEHLVDSDVVSETNCDDQPGYRLANNDEFLAQL